MTRAVVLAVDDDTDLLALIAKVLSAEYQVLTASDPHTALELAGGEPRPDLILLDIDMPGATGFELIRVLKREGRTALIPVVFLTARAAPQQASPCGPHRCSSFQHLEVLRRSSQTTRAPLGTSLRQTVAATFAANSSVAVTPSHRLR